MSADETRSLASSFASYGATLRGTVGLAYAPVGGARVVALGDWTGGVAWSTSKVPLAIAALRAAPEAAKSDVVQAITRSDNAAAERLWSMLGSPAVAAAAVAAVLGEAGDTGTRVQSRRVRPEYTAFGQTEWSTARQALFTAHLPCLEAGVEVLALMRTLDPGHRWGLARLAGAAAKGGWGPDAEGAHLVRQLGVVSNGSGWTAVVLGARPASGSFADGVALLDRLTEWVAAHLRRLPAGRCPR
ncbi:hypothetical protein DFR70_12565 [Nocardia tenerifensis]|uniref:Beta-lactamase class A n=1 Tax=Nocardia tenerifensis TaxID=228006 RepID=A0A318JSP8_9NOCA|nr:hypothetical protein [Nocardia tenerifensis]PXX54084.1 hypothetical protein DFR70_12565 [Nocardia tenerifensis]